MGKGKSGKDKAKDKPESGEGSAKERLEALQIAMVEAQIDGIAKGRKVVIVFEGRDAAGKDGAIKRLTEHQSIRNTRVIALPKPDDVEKGQWWFQRYTMLMPTTGEWVLFNRSWYNRAGVEKVMGFSTPEQQEAFIRDVPDYERLLIGSDVTLIKFWLDISKVEQDLRLTQRRKDPLKTLKLSPLDDFAQSRWKDYSKARDAMLKRSHTEAAPWICVKTDDKVAARENILRHVLKVLNCPTHKQKPPLPDDTVLFSYDAVLSGQKKLFA
jgi:polyphosphate kinase